MSEIKIKPPVRDGASKPIVVRLEREIVQFYRDAKKVSNNTGRNPYNVTVERCIDYNLRHGFEATVKEYLKLTDEEYQEIKDKFE